MNNKVRRYLIDMARKLSVVTYQKLSDDCKLNLNMTDEIDRGLMSNILAEINFNEMSKGRPVLSFMTAQPEDPATYKGIDIIPLAEDLNIHEWDKFSSQGVFHAQHISLCVSFWSDDENYTKYY
jgi:hypothetical protein